MGLFKPAWQRDNDEKAVKAIDKMDNQSELALVVMKARKHWIRQKAFDKLTDQIILADIAKKGEYTGFRMQATKKLIDKSLAQEVFTDIARKGKHIRERMEAAERLTDQSLAQDVFADIFRNCEDVDTRIKAFDKLTDKTILADIATSYTDTVWRSHACKKLTDDKHMIEGCTCKLCGSVFHEFKVVGSSSSNEKHHTGSDMIVTTKTLKCYKCGIETEKEDVTYLGYDPDYNR